MQANPAWTQATPPGVQASPAGPQATPARAPATPAAAQATPAGPQPTPAGTQASPPSHHQQPECMKGSSTEAKLSAVGGCMQEGQPAAAAAHAQADTHAAHQVGVQSCPALSEHSRTAVYVCAHLKAPLSAHEDMHREQLIS